MTMNFPNQNRWFDQTRRAVRFWGSDNAVECAFSIGNDALRVIDIDAPIDEAGLLAVFDANRDRIIAVAGKLYSRKRQTYYEILAVDMN